MAARPLVSVAGLDGQAEGQVRTGRASLRPGRACGAGMGARQPPWGPAPGAADQHAAQGAAMTAMGGPACPAWACPPAWPPSGAAGAGWQPWEAALGGRPRLAPAAWRAAAAWERPCHAHCRRRAAWERHMPRRCAAAGSRRRAARARPPALQQLGAALQWVRRQLQRGSKQGSSIGPPLRRAAASACEPTVPAAGPVPAAAGGPACRVRGADPLGHCADGAHPHGQERASGVRRVRQGRPPDGGRVLGHWSRRVAYPARARRRHPPRRCVPLPAAAAVCYA